jgi:hypothetical protein
LKYIFREKIYLTFVITITCFLTYLVFWSGHHYSIDGIVMFNYAKALIFQHSWVMSPPIHWNGMDISVSKWAIGMSLAYVPLLWFFAGTIFRYHPGYTNIPYDPSIEFNSQLLQNTSYLSVSLLNPLFTAITAGLSFIFVQELGFTKRQAIAISLIYGVLSPAAVYAKFDYSQPLSSLFLLLSIILLNHGVINFKYTYLVGAGISLGLSALARTEIGLMTYPVIVLALIWNNNLLRNHDNFDLLRSLSAFSIPIILMMTVTQFINYQRFHSLTAVGYNFGNDFGIDIIKFVKAFWGNLFSPGRGLFIHFPLALLTLVVIPKIHKKFVYVVVAGLLVISLIFYSCWVEWSGGISWGPRFMIPFLPYWTILGFIGYNKLKSHRQAIAKYLLVITTFIGGIFTTQGLLFNFLDFYSKLQLSTEQIVKGNYNFQIASSPIFADWSKLLQPQEYDIFWIQSYSHWKGSIKWWLIITVISLAIITSLWLIYLFHNENGETSKVSKH